MKKYIGVWFVLTFSIAIILFLLCSVLTSTEINRLEFNEALILIGFSTTLSSLATCTMILRDNNK